MKIREITDCIEQLSPLDHAEDFDNVGLLVGDANAEVNGILVSLDCLESTVDEAIEKKCNLIVSFHPIIFKGLKKINGSNYVERTVIKAIKHDIAIYAMHTALDNVPGGVSGKMAEMLGLGSRQILVPKTDQVIKLTTYVPADAAPALREALFAAGGGNIGNYSHCSFNAAGQGTYLGNESTDPAIGEKLSLQKVDEVMLSLVFERHLEKKVLRALLDQHPYEQVAYELSAVDNGDHRIGMGMVGELEEAMDTVEFLEKVKKTFKVPVIRHSDIHKKKIRKVAVLGGSGSFAISRAIRSGADLYLTADLKYHDFFRAENRIILADIGHYESEQFTKNLLVDHLTKKITNFAPALPESRIILSNTSTNPINYT